MRPENAAEFVLISDLVRRTALEAPQRVALFDDERSLSYRGLDDWIDRVAAALQRDGVRARETIAICAVSSLEYVATFLGALRAGVVVAPLAPSATAKSLADMARDCEARLLFLDATTQAAVSEVEARVARIALDEQAEGARFQDWLAPPAPRPRRWPSNPIGSSTPSIPPAPLARPRASTSRTPCASAISAAPASSNTGRRR